MNHLPRRSENYGSAILTSLAEPRDRDPRGVLNPGQGTDHVHAGAADSVEGGGPDRGRRRSRASVHLRGRRGAGGRPDRGEGAVWGERWGLGAPAARKAAECRSAGGHPEHGEKTGWKGPLSAGK